MPALPSGQQLLPGLFAWLKRSGGRSSLAQSMGAFIAEEEARLLPLSKTPSLRKPRYHGTRSTTISKKGPTPGSYENLPIRPELLKPTNKYELSRVYSTTNPDLARTFAGPQGEILKGWVPKLRYANLHKPPSPSMYTRLASTYGVSEATYRRLLHQYAELDDSLVRGRPTLGAAVSMHSDILQRYRTLPRRPDGSDPHLADAFHHFQTRDLETAQTNALVDKITPPGQLSALPTPPFQGPRYRRTESAETPTKFLKALGFQGSHDLDWFFKGKKTPADFLRQTETHTPRGVYRSKPVPPKPNLIPPSILPRPALPPPLPSPPPRNAVPPSSGHLFLNPETIRAQLPFMSNDQVLQLMVQVQRQGYHKFKPHLALPIPDSDLLEEALILMSEVRTRDSLDSILNELSAHTTGAKTYVQMWNGKYEPDIPF